MRCVCVCHRVFLREKRFFSNGTVSHPAQRAWLFSFVPFSLSLFHSPSLSHSHSTHTNTALFYSFFFPPILPPPRSPIYVSACPSIYLHSHLSVCLSAIYLSVSPGSAYQDPLASGRIKGRSAHSTLKKLGKRQEK